jgi:transaldolase
LWNDSASVEELTYSIDHGAVGATCNPSIVVSVLKKEMPIWKPRILALAASHPKATEDEIAWLLVEEMSVNAAKLLKPIFDREKGHNGRLSIQTDPRTYKNSEAILEQAIHFSQLAPNMIVKIAATRAGIVAIEEATYRGISINATVSFTLPQAIAVAEAVERGLKRREAEGLEIATMGPVCTLMVGSRSLWRSRSSPSIPVTWSGLVLRSSRRHTSCTASAATGCGFFLRHFAITCTGASSLEGTW